MFFARTWRKKRKVPLSPLRRAPQSRPAMSQWLPPLQDVPNRERAWFNSIWQSHRCFCGCADPIRHLGHLAARYNMQPGPSPGGDPRPPRPPSLRRYPALPGPDTPASNPPPRPCRGGDGAEGGAGPAGDGGPTAADEDYRAEDLDALYAAIEGEE